MTETAIEPIRIEGNTLTYTGECQVAHRCEADDGSILIHTESQAERAKMVRALETQGYKILDNSNDETSQPE